LALLPEADPRLRNVLRFRRAITPTHGCKQHKMQPTAAPGSRSSIESAAPGPHRRQHNTTNSLNTQRLRRTDAHLREPLSPGHYPDKKEDNGKTAGKTPANTRKSARARLNGLEGAASGQHTTQATQVAQTSTKGTHAPTETRLRRVKRAKPKQTRQSR
jgi:hypothetical protein